MTTTAMPVLTDEDEWTLVDTPVGDMLLVGDADWLHHVLLPGSFAEGAFDTHRRGEPAAVGEADRQLNGYFGGTLKEFSVPLRPAGTEFQKRVWFALAEIGYGETESYGELAGRVGNPKACRAVGLANGRNPLPVVLPCHRVIGADGGLTGYGGGLGLKRWLLEHEARVRGRE